jgi:heme oxygenase
MSKQDKKTEEMRVAFLEGIQRLAREFATAENSIPVQAHHMMAAIVDKAASAFVFNVRMAEELNALKADMEALRRAVLGNDDKPDGGGLKLVH